MNDRQIHARLARLGNLGLEVKKIFNEKGVRMTDCCGAASTLDQDGRLHCKECYIDVLTGEGDGNETKENNQ